LLIYRFYFCISSRRKKKWEPFSLLAMAIVPNFWEINTVFLDTYVKNENIGKLKKKKKTNKISWVFHHKTKSWKRSLTLPLATAWAEFPWEFSIFKSSLEQLNRLNSWSAICMAIFWCFPICELKSSTAPMLIMDLEQLFLLSWARSTLDHVNNCRTKKQIMSDILEVLPIEKCSKRCARVLISPTFPSSWFPFLWLVPTFSITYIYIYIYITYVKDIY